MAKRKSTRTTSPTSAPGPGDAMSTADLAQVLALLGGQGMMPSDLAPAPRAKTRHRARRTPTYYRVRVDLDRAKPPIWRRLQLASELRLDEVHEVLQVAFDWYGGHLHEFSHGTWPPGERFLCDFMVEDGDKGTPEEEVRLDQVMARPGDKLSYWYDFGDDWRHTIKLEAVSPRPDGAPLASVEAGRRAAPPDDCGGIWGYESLLEAVADPTHPEHEEMSAWLGEYGGGEGFDPAHVDLEGLDERVRSVLG